MALGSALVDRAQKVTKAATGPKVDGTTQLTPVSSPTFRCRLFLPAAPETDDGTGRSRGRAVSRPQLLYGPKNSEGEPVGLRANDKVEVVSRELGTALWQLTGEPEVLRRRRSIVGYLANLERVVDRERQPEGAVP